MKSNVRDLNKFATEIRITILKGLGVLGFGHVGGSMSMAELMAVLYGESMNVDINNPKWEDRDWYIQSKGHSGPALYATLALKGFFPYEEIFTINKPNSNLPSHCDMNKTKGVDMTTGSLGQGMSTAIGVALGNKLKEKSSYTYLLLGDGECDEGQVWEGALFASTKKLDNLIAFVDKNQKQLDGYTEEICELGDLRKKFEEFGWNALEIDGHDVNAIANAIEDSKKKNGKPNMIILNTEKGKGCTFTEGVLNNHHVIFSKEECDEAISKLESVLISL